MLMYVADGLLEFESSWRLREVVEASECRVSVGILYFSHAYIHTYMYCADHISWRLGTLKTGQIDHLCPLL
jgi:hypothetical protein